MDYTINQLAKISQVTTRTLRYYDQIGLLKAKRQVGSNYRYYSTEEVDKLQQILFYRELGFDLKDIKSLIAKSQKDFLNQLEMHIDRLRDEKNRLQKLIENVEKTLLHQKGVTFMSDKEKFEGFKHQLLKENDEKYQDEVISRWGHESYEKSRNAFKHMTEKAYNDFQELGQQIIDALLLTYKEGNDPASLHAQKAAKLHQEWIKTAWGSYNSDAHLNVVDMYVNDERFKSYYDNHHEGLAQLLRDSVYHLLLNED